MASIVRAHRTGKIIVSHVARQKPFTKASLTQLVSKMRIRMLPEQRKMNNAEGVVGRIKFMRTTVTALVKYERIEASFYRADESRGYAERLISEAVRHGDCHRPTMDLAKFWLEDPALVPKLFKVLVPRYENWPMGLPYTRMLRTPSSYSDFTDFEGMRRRFAVLELRGNPYPPLPGPMVAKPHPGLLHNVLLEEARKEYYKSQSLLAQEAETEIQAIPDTDTCHLENVSEEDLQELSEALNQEVINKSHDGSQPEPEVGKK